ncbi:MAG: HD domain-containing protein [Actinophytocola sp.]|uniref:HD domain-containing protein n=1 Tax=Actinophytocola sp. TaxID=1872138 RepID=UPI00132B8C72|nr:HD domain-containing protein [Actinophytocola sp.]MPZ84084.1 HD domain-containing protein [Actinophytocola sp.]
MMQTFEAANWPTLRASLSLPAPDLVKLDEAVEFAEHRHATQTRPAGEPYVEHLLEALSVLTTIGTTDIDVLRAAVLHDVVEDTDCELAEVRATFGDRVAELVGWVTKSDDREAYLERLRSAPRDALLVKLADRLSNVQRLNTHPRPDKQRSYYAETVRSIVPLAESHAWFQAWFAEWRQTFAHLR